MPEEFEVADIQEAVSLAQEHKTAGRYNWFRGQVRDWPPRSSMTRAFLGDPTKHKGKRALRRIKMFLMWAADTPGLTELAHPDNVHKAMAIAQHYGIPTHYIDFTTDPAVAGFFAADTTSPPKGGRSCIYCLNTEELSNVWDIVKTLDDRQGAELELIEIDVDNLWRLQAQRGTFVYANYNWEIDYPMDRIVFPYLGYPAYPTADRIYPRDKSPLEQNLDRYFWHERTTFAHEELLEEVAQLRARHVDADIVYWKSFAEGYYSDAFIDPSALSVPLPSWSSEALRGWNQDPREEYFVTQGPRRQITVGEGTSPADIGKSIGFGVRQIILGEPDIRSKSVDWVVSGLPDAVTPEDLHEMLRPAWNGMRRLPYTPDEVSEALGNIAAMFIAGLTPQTLMEDAERILSDFFASPFRVGLGHIDGSGSNGWASARILTDTLREDMADLLRPDHRHRTSDVAEMFAVAHRPSIMFDFIKFTSVFARTVVPTQILTGSDSVIFNPAHVQIFGIP